MKACINLYNDCQFLATCLESLKEHVDEIIIADGAYELYYRQFKEAYKKAEPWSTDGSLQIVEGFYPDCQELQQQGFKILVPNAASHLLDGIEIDYENKLMGGGFKINNPNASSSCGCGESFA